jgi:hypothetical protein
MFIFEVFKMKVLLLAFVASAFGIAAPDTISYQLHSWNDLREVCPPRSPSPPQWPAGLRKGATAWKIDFHFTSGQHCHGKVPPPTSRDRA